MRIIAGKLRGRKLLPPEETNVTRPVTDRVKQSIFDILTPLIPDARVYDCFAGTGSMGLECLSRGASEVVFFEADRSAVTRLRKNIETLNVKDKCTIVAADLFRWFLDAASGQESRERVDLAFLDPPYRFLNERAADLQRVASALAEHHMASEGTVVFRHNASDALELVSLNRYDSRSYGGMTVELLRPAGT